MKQYFRAIFANTLETFGDTKCCIFSFCFKKRLSTQKPIYTTPAKDGFKGKRTQKYIWCLSKRIWKTAHFDANCMKTGFLFFKKLRFSVFKMGDNGGRHFEINIKTESY